MTLKKWNKNFRSENSDRKNRTTFSDVSLLSETDFPQKRPQKSGYQRFFSRAVGIFGVGRRPTHVRPYAEATSIKTWQKPETALEKSLAPRVAKVLFHLLSNQTFRKLFVNGKQPTSELPIYAKLRSYCCHIIMTQLHLLTFASMKQPIQ